MRALLAARHKELAAGASAVGWKVAFNVPAVQELFGLDGPVVGFLNTTTVRADGAVIDLTGWQSPALEVEVALRVGPDGRVSAVAPALELVDLDLPFDDLQPILGGNLFHRGVVFGPETAPDACRGLEIRVESVADGAERSRGTFSDDPAITLEVVRTFLAEHGADLEPGHRIIAGSIGPAVPVARGDRVRVDFGLLGHLGLSFSGS
jgi:2-oxo-hept-3-ene-1,7-dioate hydratase